MKTKNLLSLAFLIFISCSKKSSNNSQLSIFDENTSIGEKVILPLLIHYKESTIWTSPEKLKSVVAVMQNIYNQANINLDIEFSDSMTEVSDRVDVHFVNHYGMCGYWNLTDGYGYREVRIYDSCQLGTLPSNVESLPLPNNLKTEEQDSVKVQFQDRVSATAAAHEVGHALSLNHWEGTFMAAAPTFMNMDLSQASSVRNVAKKLFPEPTEDCYIGKISVDKKYSSTENLCGVWIKKSSKVLQPDIRNQETCDVADFEKLKAIHKNICATYTDYISKNE